ALGVALLASMIVFARDQAARRFNSGRSAASSRPLSKLGGTSLLRHPDGMAAILLLLLAIGVVPGLVATTATDLGNVAAAARQSQQRDDDSPFWSSVREQKITGLVLAPAGLAFKALRYGHLPI